MQKYYLYLAAGIVILIKLNIYKKITDVVWTEIYEDNILGEMVTAA